LVNQLQPQTLVYIAIDGVAPLAKMAQQRQRRFKSIQERRDRARIKRQHQVDPGLDYDFNMISPGTQFMADLHQALTRFIEEEAPRRYPGLSWVLDGADQPGEGEHKIMAQLRDNGPGQYCIYGADADLIFLSLGLGSEYQVILAREGLAQGGPKTDKRPGSGSGSVPDDKVALDLLSVSQLSQVIEELFGPEVTPLELSSICHKAHSASHLPVPDLNRTQIRSRVIDYIALCFLVGNDFLPALPSLKIRLNGLDNLSMIYKYLQYAGAGPIIDPESLAFNLPLWKQILKFLAKQEDSVVLELNNPTWGQKDLLRRPHGLEQQLRRLEVSKIDTFDWGKDWQARYLDYYWGFSELDLIQQERLLRQIAQEYFIGMNWVLRYYLKGCASWTWSYPFMAGLPASLLINYFGIEDVSWPLSQPVHPVIQLMMILPPESSHLLPAPYRSLMTRDLQAWYPTRFKSKSIGCLWTHEEVPVLPVISLEALEQYLRRRQLHPEDKS
jgi:5'-3' exonuclease